MTLNSVLGSPVRNPTDALTIAERARALGLTSTVGILHDGGGHLRPLAPDHAAVYERILAFDQSLFSFAQYDRFQRNIARGLPNDWHCRAGGRFLYICEDGLVHYCSQQMGHPGVPLADYTVADLERERSTVKACAPYCTVGCVHRVALLDDLREKPLETLNAWFSTGSGGPELPPAVAVLVRLLVTGRVRNLARSLGRKLLRV